MGDWGLGIGDWGSGSQFLVPSFQSPSLLITNRVIFQILFAKLRAASIRSGLRFRSWPGVPLVASVKRSASVPC